MTDAETALERWAHEGARAGLALTITTAGGGRCLAVAGADDLLGAALTAFPDLAGFLGRASPIGINCYPAPVAMGGAVFVDAYVRRPVLSRALAFARELRRGAVVAAQPLALLDFLLGHVRAGRPLPYRVLCLLGGYPCPAGLETVLLDTLAAGGAAGRVVHLYGTRALGLACLAGVRAPGASEIGWVRASTRVEPVERDGRLFLQAAGQGEVFLRHDTGDGVEAAAGVFRIRSAPARVEPELFDVLAGWAAPQWERRTGHVGWDDGWRFQLRDGEAGAAADELAFHAFAARFGFAWTEKPSWGSRRHLRFMPASAAGR